MSKARQTHPSLTLRYALDEATGLLAWTLNLSDGTNAAAPVVVSAETAAGIAQTFDVALPNPVMLGSEATTAEHVVRYAHWQLLSAQLAEAQAELKASEPARSTTVERTPALAAGPVAPAAKAEPTAAPAPTRAPRSRTATTKATKAPVVALVPPVAEEQPDLGEPLTVEPEAPAVVDVEPPREYQDAPEFLPRANHLVIPAVEEF